MKENTIKIIGIVFGLLMIYATYLLILISIPFLQIKPNVEFLSTKQLIYHIDIWRLSFYIHVFSSPFIMIAGLMQFNRFLFHKHRKIHRISGYVYVVIVLLISGPSAFVMSLYANGGYPAQISFVILNLLWITSTFLALNEVRKGNYQKHFNWMLRSFALTLSAVTLRFYAYLFDVFHVPLHPVTAYIVLAYMGWIPNLLIAEILIKRNLVKHYFVSKSF